MVFLKKYFLPKEKADYDREFHRKRLPALVLPFFKKHRVHRLCIGALTLVPMDDWSGSSEKLEYRLQGRDKCSFYFGKHRYKHKYIIESASSVH